MTKNNLPAPEGKKCSGSLKIMHGEVHIGNSTIMRRRVSEKNIEKKVTELSK